MTNFVTIILGSLAAISCQAQVLKVVSKAPPPVSQKPSQPDALSPLPVIAKNQPSFQTRIKEFRAHYSPVIGAKNPLMAKIVDNRGNGYENLYGLRNMRVVLHGVFYRGGANNAYHRANKRDNSNPLPTDGLQNLCKESFGEAIYLYSKNFASQNISCDSRLSQKNSLAYSQISVLGTPINGLPNASTSVSENISTQGNGVRVILDKIYRCATGEGGCPIYAHCWNGWHASGFIAAVALRQFCGFSPEQAEKYWIEGTDSLENSNYPSIKADIRAFKPLTNLLLPRDIQTEICPQNPY